MIPRDSTCCGVNPLIAAWVATGIKVGSIVTPSSKWVCLASVSKKLKRLTSEFHATYSSICRMTLRNDFKLHPSCVDGV